MAAPVAADCAGTVWATALYAGLRSGELQALPDDLVDLEVNVLRVEWSWDPSSTALPGTSRRPVLRPARRPAFSNQSLSQRATRTWQRAGLEPIGLHECRHTFASLMIAAGVNAKALSTFPGHASVTITLDRYGHLFPGSRHEAAGLLHRYLERSIG